MFKRIYVNSYKSLVNFDLPLDSLTLLLGRNGTGKTSVLDVFFAMQQLLSGVAKVTDPAVFPTRTLTRWQSANLQTFEVDVQLERNSYKYRVEVEHDRDQNRARISLEELFLNDRPLFVCEMGDVQLYRDDHSPGPSFSVDWSESALARVAPRDDNRCLTRFLEFFRRVLVCGIYPVGFETESRSEDILLLRDARNFAGWYRNALLERQDLVPDFTKAMEEVINGFRGIRLERVGLDTRALMVMFDGRESRFELRLDEVSDGERALIALYALTRLTAGQGYTIFLDEPDNYVALTELQPWLMELSDSCGETIPQAVICSHHPELIDYLGADHGVLLKSESSGLTKAERLTNLHFQNGLKLSEAIARGWEL